MTQDNVFLQMILKFFEIFLKMKDLTSSEAFLVSVVYFMLLSCHSLIVMNI